MATRTLEPLHDCLGQWREEQTRIEADLAESFDALDAFQRQLDSWQQSLASERVQLAKERAEFQQERTRLEEERAEFDELRAEGSESEEANTGYAEELAAIRERVAELEGEVQLREERLAEAEIECARLSGELDAAGRREEELSRAAKSAPRAPRRGPDEAEESGAPRKRGIADPVLGSVVAQFGKLRQQRAGRNNP